MRPSAFHASGSHWEATGRPMGGKGFAAVTKGLKPLWEAPVGAGRRLA